ncbi:hypothetical protein ES705_37084 [subsurface metagenome]
MKNYIKTSELSSEKLKRGENATFFLYPDIDENLQKKSEFSTYLDITAEVGVKTKTEQAQISCKGRWISVKCDCNNGQPRPLQIGGCMNENCIDCSEAIKLRRRRKVLRKLNAKRYTSPVMYTVFTVPLDVRKRALSSKTWSYWRECIVEVLKRDYGLRYGVESSHPIGDDENIFHPHMNFLWIQKAEFMHKLNLRKLQASWKKIIKTEKEVEKIDIYNHWYKNRYKIIHLVGYVVRAFPGWKFWRGQATRWYGEFPREKDIDYESYDPDDWICPDCGKKIEFIELIHDYVRGNNRFYWNKIKIRGFT